MSYDVIVIGGGIAGSAAIYRLASEGHKAAIIEKDSPAAHASGFAFGWVMARYSPPPGSGSLEMLRARSIDLHHELSVVLPELSGEGYHFQEKAGLVLAFEESEAEQLRQHGRAAFLRDEWPAERQDVRWLAYGELSHIEARVSTDVIGALYLGGSAEISPGGLTNALWGAATNHYDADAINAEVIEINVENNKVIGVTTSEGFVAGGSVVLAAGPWSGQILQHGSGTTHLNLPIEPLKGEILRYDIGDEPPMPVSLWWGDDYASSKPDGLLYTGTTEDYAGFDEAPSESGRSKVASSATRALPFLADKSVLHQTACLRPVTPDRLPVIGEMPGVQGLIVASGGGRIGIELGPGLGFSAASIAMGDSSVGVAYPGLSPDRFA